MTPGKGLSATTAAIVFTLLVPTPMAAGIPYLITRRQMQPPLSGFETGWLGTVMIAAGAVALLSAIAWFAREGVKPHQPIARVITTGPRHRLAASVLRLRMDHRRSVNRQAHGQDV